MPHIDPDVLCVEVQSGEATRIGITISEILAPTTLSLSLRSTSTFIKVSDVTLTRTFRRPASEEEIRELPPRPPSIRENARRNGIEETVTTSQGPGAVRLERGEVGGVILEFSVPPQTVEGIRVDSLLITGPAFETIEIPIFCVIGRPVAVPKVEPDRIRCALVPGESTVRSAFINSAPTSDQVIACVSGGRGFIHLGQLISMKEVRRPATEEEINELPRFPPSIREDVRRHGIIEHVEAGRSNGSTPLAVGAGNQLYANVEFSAPAAGTSLITDAELIIESPRWQASRVPLRLIVGDISVQLLSSAVSVAQGKTVELIATVFSHSGPGDSVHFSLDDDDDRLQVFPESTPIQPRQSTTVRLTLSAANDAPIGKLPAVLVVRVFEQMLERRVPLTVEIVAGALTISTRPFSLRARQGETIAFDVTAFSEGGTKRIAVGPGSLPRGVRMDSADFTFGPAPGVHVQPMRLFIDRDAPEIRDAWNPIQWTANGGMQSGLTNLPLTIELVPESRTFQQQITTPSGTALGGSVELTVHNDGRFVFRGHMHGSGFDPYAFRIGYFMRGTNMALVLSDVFSGRVGGTVGGGPRDRDWIVEGNNPLLRAHWNSFRDARAEFTKWYENTGVLGTLESLVEPLAEFLLVRVLAGPAAAAILILGPELARIAELPVTSPRAIPGAIILGGTIFLFGPLAAVPAVVAGLAIASAEDVRSRRMHASEIASVSRVFGDTLPIDRIRVTNLLKRKNGEERAFVTFNRIDNTILVNMGERFKTEMVDDSDFVHELTHAWQHAHRAFSIQDMWGDIERPFMSSAAEAELYRPRPPGTPWRDFHSEAQARVVETWYMAYRANLDSEAARSDPYFPYIANNIRTGQN